MALGLRGRGEGGRGEGKNGGKSQQKEERERVMKGVGEVGANWYYSCNSA